MPSPRSRRYSQEEYGAAEPYDSSGLDLTYTSLADQIGNLGNRGAERAPPSEIPGRLLAASEQQFDFLHANGRNFPNRFTETPNPMVSSPFQFGPREVPSAPASQNPFSGDWSPSRNIDPQRWSSLGGFGVSLNRYSEASIPYGRNEEQLNSYFSPTAGRIGTNQTNRSPFGNGPRIPPPEHRGPRVALTYGENNSYQDGSTMSNPSTAVPRSSLPSTELQAQTLHEDSDKENSFPEAMMRPSYERGTLFSRIAQSSRFEFVQQGGASVYVREDRYQNHLADTREAVGEHLQRSRTDRENSTTALNSIEDDSDADTIRADSVPLPPRGGGKDVSLYPIKSIRLTHHPKSAEKKSSQQGGKSWTKRVRITSPPKYEETKQPGKNKKTSDWENSDEDVGDDENDSDFAPKRSRKFKAGKQPGVTKSLSSTKAPSSGSHEYCTPSSSRNHPKNMKYTPRTDFARGRRPEFAARGLKYSKIELERVKFEYEAYITDHPDKDNRLHSEFLGWYISDILYDKYGINRTGNAIKLCFQRWVRGVLTNVDDRTPAHQDSNKLRTSLQFNSSQKTPTATAARVSTGAPSSTRHQSQKSDNNEVHYSSDSSETLADSEDEDEDESQNVGNRPGRETQYSGWGSGGKGRYPAYRSMKRSAAAASLSPVGRRSKKSNGGMDAYASDSSDTLVGNDGEGESHAGHGAGEKTQNDTYRSRKRGGVEKAKRTVRHMEEDDKEEDIGGGDVDENEHAE